MERLTRIGKIKPKHSSEIKKSRIGIGFEKLDRDVFDPEKAYDKVAATGVKWVRIQSGWARTEKAKGEYDFKWLDSIVNNLLNRGLMPWICLCYGNGIYDTEAKKVFGAVGCPPIYSEEAKIAWRNYVNEVVKRYKDMVQYYEVWNEPDGVWCWKRGVNAKEYGYFAIDTAKAVKNANPEAKVIGGVICRRDLNYINTAFLTGMGNYIDAISFHEYTHKEHLVFERVAALKGLCNEYNSNIEIIQGESGSQSKSGGNGSLKTGAWTQRKQAKQLLRHTIADLMTEVKFTSYFSSLDMIEALHGIVDDKSSYMDFGYFGVLAAEFDENGFATGEYTPKLSYTALQNICSIFCEDFKRVDLPIIFQTKESGRIFAKDVSEPTMITAGFKKPNGAAAFVYWNSTDLMTTEFESTVSVQIAALKGDLKLLDLMDGKVYKIPETMIEINGEDCISLNNIPIRDYPLLLTIGDF